MKRTMFTKKARRERKTGAVCFVFGAALMALFAPLAVRAQPAPAAPPANILEQVGDALTQLTRTAQPCIVTIRPRAQTLVFPLLPRSLSPQQRAALTPEKQKEYDETLANAAREIGEFVNSARAMMKAAFMGSGFVLRGGFVVTTAEVAERIEEPTVVFSDGRRAEVLWVNADSPSNIAVLKISGPSDTGLSWADSATVEPGNMAVAIGNQDEFPRSVSLGIISGLGRAGRSGPHHYENLIQFQGAVGAGGSGGPLLNARGELIGMVVAAPADVFGGGRVRFERNGHSAAHNDPKIPPAPPAMPFTGLSNMGFALAANDIRPITEILCRREKRPTPGYIGIFLSSDMEAPRPQVIGILPNSPAEKAGLLLGDTITEINGQTFRMASELRAFAGRVAAGAALKITIRRGSELKTVNLTAQARPTK